jgi:tetratricopeptide (TPR) repeat protein
MTARNLFSLPTTFWRRGIGWLRLAKRHPDRVHELRDRIRGDLSRLEIDYDTQMMDDTIILARELIVLSPQHDSDRMDAYSLLASLLYQRFLREDDVKLLKTAIQLQRRALSLSPEAVPYRARGCGNLAISLSMWYKYTGDARDIEEAIDLGREALDLRPEGHPLRPWSCQGLASSLSTHFERTGEVQFLDEAITFEREVLDLCPPGHPLRSSACENLACTLITYYERMHHDDLLDEAILLQREALLLRPEGHPKRWSSCGNLAGLLMKRYSPTKDDYLLDELIDLQREAYALCPIDIGRSDRAMTCGNLASSLQMHYWRTHDVRVLAEAIDFGRKALNARPEGQHHRALSCLSLATSLMMHYDHTSNVNLLDEAIDLQGEALVLRPVGHPDRWLSCERLAISLTTRYERTSDEAVLNRIFTLTHEAVTIAPVHAVWRHLCVLAWIHLQKATEFYDVSLALSYMSQCLESDHDDIAQVVQTLLDCLEYIWDHDCDVEEKHVKLITIYQSLVKLLPLLVHPALDLQPQLRLFRDSNRLGSDAFVNAALTGGRSTLGLEALELVQGVIWSQSLYRRNPQLEVLPKPLANKLKELLQAVNTHSTAEPHHKQATALNPRDMLHVNSSELFALLREIRALPGLDRFMLGETFDTLRIVASDHPVVVLVGARSHYYALIMASSFAHGHELISLDLNDEDLKNVPFVYGSRRAQRSGDTPEEMPEEGDRGGLNKTKNPSSGPLDGQLKTLWNKVVKPVLNQLDLKASASNISNV